MSHTGTGGNMNIKALTDEQVAKFVADIIKYAKNSSNFVAPLYAIVARIEQAVLQSERVQALRNALQEVVDAADGDGWKVLDATFEKQRAALAAMKLATSTPLTRQIADAAQDREDAERYRYLSSIATQQADALGPIFRIDVRRPPQALFNFDAAVDHARRAEGEGE